ncbi:DUF1592 domain-containing protein [Sorangium cellulosum]|uniref:Uncharacterized protein n=1 Tax=Sorangium cellulosum TaxID=56 RepID=A0A150QSD4_SORCE|nr:DUF1592 domain-containing protein [Sorangium cellulosum]KYF70586.1 hypothetical protein BE15_37030 [Sorangium cellulosum]
MAEPRALRWPIGLLLLASCSGQFGELPAHDGDDGEATAPLCTAIEPGESPLRRMTRVEYDNTIADLLGDETRPARGFVPEEESLGFNNQAAALVVSPLLAEQYMAAAEGIAERAAGKLLGEAPACREAAGGAACREEIAALVASLGKRAFRRPLAEDEIDDFVALFQRGIALGDAPDDAPTGLALVVQAMLQSPHFLYRVELGMPDPVEGDVVQLTSYEVASRLSYLLWGTMPDDALFTAAERGALGTAAEIEAQARRMLEDPRAREAVKNFHRQWLGLAKIDEVAAGGKDPELYPEYRDELLSLFQAETEAFLDHAIFEEDASVTTLFTAPYSMMNRELAEFYGVEGGPRGDAFERVALDPSQRAGFVTHAGLLSLYAKPNRSSPVHRGRFVRQSLLCQIPPPPPDVVPEPPMVDPTKTTREQFSQHVSDPGCRSCHALLDPIGFGFEHYDALGRWRDAENGIPVDASGELTQTDVDGPFDGAVELAHRLAESEQVRACVVKQWFRFGQGRAEQGEDACSLSQATQAFEASGYNIKALLVALTQTDAFRYRRAIVAPSAEGGAAEGEP